MALIIRNTDSFRSLSQIFSSSSFNKVVREDNTRLVEKRIKKYISLPTSQSSYKKVLKSLYLELQNEYCSEYFYKNNLLNEYLLKTYSLNTTTVFDEFKIGSSIADFVLLNGSAKIYEIKTDLDGLYKLEKQLNDYRKFADFVYIVTSSKYINKILSDYSNSTIGVIEFTSTNTFKEHKPALSNQSFFDHNTIFKALRKSEYLDIISSQFGFTPDVPNTKIFRECLGLISKIDAGEFQKIALKVLKKRKIKCPELLKSEKTPFELKQICYSLDFSEQEYKTLYKFLHKSI